MTTFRADKALLDGLGTDPARWAQAFIAITEQDVDATAFDPEWVADWFEYALSAAEPTDWPAHVQPSTPAPAPSSGGVWVSYYTDMSMVVPFGAEIDALRHAVDKNAKAILLPYGQDLQES